MHNIVSSRRRLWGLSLLLAGAFAVPLGAQQATGSLTGRITDRTTGAPLEDARIRIIGTALETSTNPRGEYRITSLRAGRVQVSVLRLGYRATSDTVQVTAGETVTRDFVLDATMTTLTDVVRARYYVAEREFVARVYSILGEHFGDIRPAATMVVCGLAEPEMKVEIEVTALRRRS